MRKFLRVTSLKRVLPVFIAFAVIAGGTYFVKSQHLYGQWKQDRLYKAAVEAQKKKDFKSASLAARQLLKENPYHFGATEIMADLSANLRRPEAVLWRQRLVQLRPGSTKHRLDLASAAMAHNDPRLAKEALDKVKEEDRETAEFHRVAANIAFAMGNLSEAETQTIKLLKFEPDVVENQLKLHLIHLSSKNPKLSKEARDKLAQIAERLEFRKLALRALSGDALRRRDSKRAVELANLIGSAPDARFEDHILRLEILSLCGDPAFRSVLKTAEDEALKKPGQLFTLLRWLNGHKLGVEALDWSKQFSPEIMNLQVINLALAESYVVSTNWSGMEVWLKSRDWKEMDYLRNAFRSLAARQAKDTKSGEELWGKAVAGAAGKPDSLASLARVAYQWGWQKEAIETWWLLAKDKEHAKPALGLLTQVYKMKNDTAGLYKVAERKRQLDIHDLNNNNNYVLLSLLLNTNIEQAVELARDIHQKNPTNSFVASTYAYALHEDGNTPKALKVFNGLPEEDLRDPAIAAYYGVLLASEGQAEDAKRYLQLAKRSQLLPEEQSLVNEAWQKLDRK
jgi:tetratricopeptide (TPR) repeat protein